MEDYKEAEARKNSKKTHPFRTANIFSKIFFTWLFPLFRKGFKKELLADDLFPPLPSHESTYLGDRLEKQWLRQLKTRPNNPSLWRAIARVFGKEFIILGLCYLFCELFARLSQPFFLSKLLEYYEPGSNMPKQEAFLYAGAIAVSTFVSQAFIHNFMLNNFHLGMKIRVATSALIYRKALKLSKAALVETTVGQMVNLISNDVGRFELATTHIHSLWMAPVELTVVLVLIYFSSGPTGMIGVIALILFVPLQMWLGKKTSEFRLATALRTDERIRLMNEIISGIQVIKMYTWEKPFAKLVEFTRRREIAQIKKISIIRAIMMSLNLFLTRTAIYTCIVVYILTGNGVLTAQYVYVLQSLYAILRYSVTMFFPQGVTQVAEANISVKRIKKFLMYEEVDFDSSATFYNALESKEDIKNVKNGGPKLDGPIGISIKDASFKWIKSQSEPTLENINLQVSNENLAVIIGPVGSGKTTLLHAILGELTSTSGSIKVTGKISYASQEPWLFVGSVRQNITFGQPFDARRYHEVVRVCQLQRDFTLFPHGDRTIVGERGVSLSGGQRARINLARAVYKQADIYLLDDPLSAVDAHVGKEMFEECITGYLKNKCVVLVTHQLQYLKYVENIYLLGHGSIEHSGSYDEIQRAGNNFAQLLQDLKDIMDDQEVEEVEEVIGEVMPVKRIRRVSTKEVIPKEDDKDPEVVKENKESGKLDWEVYKSYFVSGGHWCKILTLFVIFVFTQALASGMDYFLNIWVNMNQLEAKMNITQTDTTSATIPVLNLTDTFPETSINDSDIPLWLNTTDSTIQLSPFQEFWIKYIDKDILVMAYSGLIFMLIVLTIGRSLAFYRFCNKASIRLHNNMFYKIVYAPMRFFNTNPSGRILNRFSKDMNQVDEILPLTLLDTLQISLTVIAITTVVATVNVWMLLPTLIMLTIFYLIKVVFLATSRDIKRLEGIARSPVYSHLTASLQGLTTIRAFGAQEILKVEFDNYQDTYSSACFMFLSANRTFGFWLDMHCVIFIILVTMGFLLMDTDTLGGNVGLGITQAMNLTGMFQWGMRQWSELENSMTCVERIKEYADVKPEENTNTKEPPKSWPERGDLTFDRLSLRYAKEEPCVLKELTFQVRGNEKVGIVGRTGAGKSSIIMALFRLAINEGKILIDGVDAGSVPFTRLRSSLSIIPQEPVLFSGTLRKNLDPFDEYTDEALWNALEEVELKPAVSELPQGLESKMSEGGSNFSVGQRQLVCLARAIVRKNKILVLDEATANVDPHTDTLIQKTIRSKFSHCTVLTIAHRLHTIMDSDKVLVMDAGRVVEFGHPHELLQKKEGGAFYELVQQTGKAMAENLSTIADESFRKILPEEAEDKSE
ncbi:probable multidrug resistance-associated protein lethal(2)03659 [Anthonomus grandis grandis]|uniref:probable multidrug resistance-associated protein lethal(2)03659 n=1 Tax=Anthonomus grandis grandis TaxID=2921223 RepID=UPI0021665706|nr:probable multidrug resistance-associated protein lethal(2)03659 [Anthonomus grandis grandis]XP_050295812.1 probable multidrug resistance-associated protein lethal(2)03659 [Anthonomus grandis grandis]XP_050295813.1 probable multidrug resistance-associated protein lethal(2)03659 [Anthonomus grandis grandis]XP_050295814.1 probable multidrug resistance-associated protein lethal(2)03659 [Anthonomus grandis grandis]XP_050295815.1 probable multidrug resistance-associated protein lethal(2)03659 [Ant